MPLALIDMGVEAEWVFTLHSDHLWGHCLWVSLNLLRISPVWLHCCQTKVSPACTIRPSWRNRLNFVSGWSLHTTNLLAELPARQCQLAGMSETWSPGHAGSCRSCLHTTESQCWVVLCHEPQQEQNVHVSCTAQDSHLISEGLELLWGSGWQPWRILTAMPLPLILQQFWRSLTWSKQSVPLYGLVFPRKSMNLSMTSNIFSSWVPDLRDFPCVLAQGFGLWTRLLV